jgi:hypothetical protein
MNRLQSGREDALSGLLQEDGDAVAATAPFLLRINQIGKLDCLHVVGTFANAPGSRLYESGPWTTFIHAEFENWNQYWSLIWDEDGTYKEDRRGPWPSFTLIPTGEDRYAGVNTERPYRMISLRFAGNRIDFEDQPACAD